MLPHVTIGIIIDYRGGSSGFAKCIELYGGLNTKIFADNHKIKVDTLIYSTSCSLEVHDVIFCRLNKVKTNGTLIIDSWGAGLDTKINV